MTHSVAIVNSMRMRMRMKIVLEFNYNCTRKMNLRMLHVDAIATERA